MIWLFAASFALTFAVVYRGSERLEFSAPGAQGVAGATAPVRIALPITGATVSGSTAAAETSDEASGSAVTVSPPGVEHDEFAALIETAIAAESAYTRNTAIAGLSQAPAPEALAALEQVLRADSDRHNRVLALQVLLGLHDAAGLRPAMLRVVGESARDPDPYISAAAQQAQATLENASENCRWSSSAPSSVSPPSSCALR